MSRERVPGLSTDNLRPLPSLSTHRPWSLGQCKACPRESGIEHPHPPVLASTSSTTSLHTPPSKSCISTNTYSIQTREVHATLSCPTQPCHRFSGSDTLPAGSDSNYSPKRPKTSTSLHPHPLPQPSRFFSDTMGSYCHSRYKAFLLSRTIPLLFTFPLRTQFFSSASFTHFTHLSSIQNTQRLVCEHTHSFHTIFSTFSVFQRLSKPSEQAGTAFTAPTTTLID